MPTIEQERLALKSSRVVRALFLIFFLIAFGVGQTVLGLLAVVQFIWLLATGEPNQNLSRLGASLARWFADVVRYLTCVSEDKPFPWKDWPAAG
jgi:Domain of unknown function (DUF4389)